MRPQRLAGLAGLVALGALAAAAPAQAQAPWPVEPVPAQGSVGLLDLAFDSQGRGLLSSEGFDQARHRRFTGLDVREPAGAWRRSPDLAGITWGEAQIHLYGRTHALLVARRRSRLVTARGHSDGAFGALRALAGNAATYVSAADGAGNALVAYGDCCSRRTYVIERRSGHAFGRPYRLRPGGAGVAAVDGRTRVLAWWGRDGVYARVRRGGGRWGRTVRAARAQPVNGATLRAAIAPDGRIALAWYTADVREGEPTRIAAGVAVGRRSGWRSFGLERASLPEGPFQVGTPAIPVVDGAGALFVTWTGVVAHAPAVRIARIAGAGPRGRTVLSAGIRGAAVDDAAAGPRRSLAVSWSAMAEDSSITTYASLRRAPAPFGPPERLTPAGLIALAGSRVAFRPGTGEAVVAWGYVTADGTGAIRASLGPPG